MRSAGAGQKRGLRASLAGLPRQGGVDVPAAPKDAGGNTLLVQNGYKPNGSTFESKYGKGDRRPGQQGRCYLYNGTNNYSTLDAGFTASGDFTLSFNINATSFASAFHVFSASTTNDRIYFNSGSAFVIVANGTLSNFTLDKTLVAGTWYNILIRRVSGTITVYVDGVAQSDTEANAQDLDFLYFSRNGALPLPAKLFDVRYFNSAITDAQITYVVSQGRIGDAVTPTNWWKCDEQAGTRGYDSIGGNHLTHSSITESTFHATQDLYSFQNEVGYSKAYQTAQQVFTGEQAANITTISFKFRSTDNNLIIFADNTPSFYLIYCYQGSVSTSWRNGISGMTLEIDGTTGWGTTLGDLYNALCDGDIHEVVLTNLSFTSNWATNGIWINRYTGNQQWDSSTYLWDLVATDSSGNVQTLQNQPEIYLPSSDATPSQDVLGGTLTNPAVNGLNDAETQVNFNPDSVPVNANIVTTNDGDGSSYVEIPDNAAFDITDNLTVMCWAKNDSATLAGSENFFCKYDSGTNEREWLLQINTDEKFLAVIGNSTGSSNSIEKADTAIDPSDWHHYAFTFETGTVKLYIDGVEVDSTTTGTHVATLNNETSPVTIFSSLISGSATNVWNGSIEHCRIYSGDSTVLTAAQVLQCKEQSEKLLTFSGQTLVCAHELMSDTLDWSGNNLHGENNGITFTKYTVPTAYSFGDTLTATYNHFKREASSVKEDRFLLYRESLEHNSKLSKVEGYTA